MNKHIEKLIELAKENPEMDIKTFTHYEVVGEDYSHWMGKIYKVEIEEVIWDDERYYFGEDDFLDEFTHITEEEALELYKKANKADMICIFIDN